MPVAYPLLENDSPNLSGKLKRKFQGIPDDCNKAYYLASELGGNIELDFVREEGVSFNPRSARVGVILTEGVPHPSIEQLTLGILSTLLHKAGSFEISQISSQLSEDYKEKFLSLRACFEYIENNSIEKEPLYNEESLTEFAQILLALFIDDMRHVHLAPLESREEKIGWYLKRAKTYENISKKYSPYYTPFIEKWVDRNNENFGKK
jgi:hypothetical protein